MFSQELAQDIIEGFRTLMPLYKYFGWSVRRGNGVKTALFGVDSGEKSG